MFKILLGSLVAFQTINAFQSVKTKVVSGGSTEENTYNTQQCILVKSQFKDTSVRFECKNKDELRIFDYEDDSCNDDSGMSVIKKDDLPAHQSRYQIIEFNCKGLPLRDAIILIASTVIIIILIIIICCCIQYRKRTKPSTNPNNVVNYPNV